ncbi:MAG: asparagine synthase-related protein [Mobilitalea sp.]
MSAIWGMVDFYKACGNENMAKRLEEPYHTYKIDEYNKYIAENVIFGYGGQYFTSEAKKEIQPIVDNTDKLVFAADVVLDNREELFSILGVKKEKQCEIADGTLMYQIIRKYGKKSFDMFLGTYSFVYYDKDLKEIILVADAVGSRSLYYCYEGGKVYFSTLLKPILATREKEKEWNYRFLSDYLALNGYTLYTEAEETPYQNIYKVAPGQAVTINKQEIIKKDYWTPPLHRKPAKKSDEEYKKEYIKLFDTCVSSVMRSADKTGILLSGGLDSTSVACFAAPKLKDKGELLYSYTSIPEEGYVSKLSPYYITNEQKKVEITKEYLGNLSCTFLDLPGMNAYDGTVNYMERYELPYKSLQNIKWINESARSAQKDGCRMLLTGQYGNATISFGDFETHFYTLLRAGHLIKLISEINAFHRTEHYSRKKIYLHLMKDIKSALFKSRLHADEMFADVYVNAGLIKQYDIENRFRKAKLNAKNLLTLTFDEFRPYMYNKNALIQIGEFETHLSLDTGILLRDPSRDRRMIEFCMNLPENQFVSRGTERRLVREYLESYLPKEIISDHRHRGMQSADMIERLSKNWTQIYRECSAVLEEDIAYKLLNLPKITEMLEKYKEKPPSNDMFGITKILYSILLTRYLMPQE